jgi:hypothetical protein
MTPATVGAADEELVLAVSMTAGALDVIDTGVGVGAAVAVFMVGDGEGLADVRAAAGDDGGAEELAATMSAVCCAAGWVGAGAAVEG